VKELKTACYNSAIVLFEKNAVHCVAEREKKSFSKQQFLFLFFTCFNISVLLFNENYHEYIYVDKKKTSESYLSEWEDLIICIGRLAEG
jgi:hypothetical protein